jgi:hypothetical protein
MRLPQSQAAAGLRHSRDPFITQKCWIGQSCVCHFLRRIDADFSQQFDLLKNEMLPCSVARVRACCK